jgi:hypothetical protein
MKIAAKGMLPNGYFGHGRKWPRDEQIVLEVTAQEYALIAADPYIVSVLVPEVSKKSTHSKGE